MKRFCCMILILVLILSFTGCLKIQIDHVIEQDGTIETMYIFALASESAKVIKIDELISAADQQARSNGFTTTPYNRDGYKGFKASKTLRDIDLKNAAPEILGFTELPAIYKDKDWTYSPGLFENNYELMLQIDLTALYSPDALDILPSDLKESALLSIGESLIEINITLPGQALDTNADHVFSGQKSTRYQWNIPVGTTKRLHVQSILEKKQAQNTALVVSYAVPGLLLVIVSLYYIRRRIRRSSNHY